MEAKILPSLTSLHPHLYLPCFPKAQSHLGQDLDPVESAFIIVAEWAIQKYSAVEQNVEEVMILGIIGKDLKVKNTRGWRTFAWNYIKIFPRMILQQKTCGRSLYIRRDSPEQDPSAICDVKYAI